MPRARLGPVRSLLVIGAVLAVLFAFAPPSGAASPTPSPTGTGTGGAASKKLPTVTFGLGPSNGKALDGRPGFDYSTTPGTVINDHVALVNISAQPLLLLLYGTDAIEATNGAIDYKPYSGSHDGASTWLALPEVNGSQFIKVAARSTLILPFQIRVPQNASPGDHTAGIAVGLVANITGSSTKNLHLEQRVIAQVLLRVSGTPVASLSIDNLQASYNQNWNPFGEGSVTLSYVVKNTGNINLGATQVASLSGLFGGAGSVPALPKISDLIPGASTAVTVTVKGVWPEVLLTGKVKVTPVGLPNTVVPTLHVTSASTTVWAIPWALIILLLILGVGGYLLQRYRRKRAAARRRPSHSRPRKGERNGSTDDAPQVRTTDEVKDNA